jgi:hypothetical protein
MVSSLSPFILPIAGFTGSICLMLGISVLFPGWRGGAAPGRSLTPVMARLDPRDVEVLDALITAGIVPNRAEGVRWALARIRERPAYTQLREHIGKIDELKAQL